MLTFKKFTALAEAKQDETGKQQLAAFTFGRMNPPTHGHLKMVNAVREVAQQRGGTPFVFTSMTHDKKKNPLDYETKLTFIKNLFSNIRVVSNADEDVSQPIKTIFNVVGFLSNLGFTDLVLVVGSDRVDEFRQRFNKANEYFDSFEVVSAGERDPDSSDVAGMSGTKAREAAVTGDIGQFRAATGWDGQTATQLMAAVRQGMGSE